MADIICKKNNIYAIADEIIQKIKERSDPFEKITLVFHSAKIAQWFKAYYLKTQKDVLMNVECTTLSSFVNDVLNPCGTYHVLTTEEYREYLIKALLEAVHAPNYAATPVPEFAFFFGNNVVDAGNLYEFADKLATILFNMEFDCEAIPDGEHKWQRKIYDKANAYAACDKAYTPRQMFDKATSNNTIQPIGGRVYVLDNSYVSDLYQNVIETYSGKCVSEKDSITVYTMDDVVPEPNENAKLFAAPSVLREVEWLHSAICKEMARNEDVRVNDFLVYAPNINDYADAIHRVFQRTAPGFPDVPFRIVGECTEKYDMLNALQLLYQIANKGFFTRYDLMKYVKLPMIMAVKNVSDKDNEAFAQAIEATNTHRNGDGNEDWTYIKNRLLSSLLADDVVRLADEECLPFTSISMTDGDRINQLIEMICALEDWAQLFSGIDLSRAEWEKDDIQKVIEKLNVLFSNENAYGEEKNFFYSDVKKEAEKIKDVFGGTSIPVITALRLLLDAPNRYSSCPADAFAGGVTFMSLDIDNVVSEPYVYVLGMSSRNFPRIEKKNEIDCSTKHRDTAELDEITVRRLFVNAEKYNGNAPQLFFSFVNGNLQTGEEYYPCSLFYPTIIKTIDATMPLDETRAPEELYTNRELLNRIRASGLLQQNENGTTMEKPCDEASAPANATGEQSCGAEPVVKTSRMKSYLQNTMVFKYTQILKIDDDEDAIRTEEYEPIDVGSLQKYSLVKKIIIGKAEGASVEQDALHREKQLPRDLEDAYFGYYNVLAQPVYDDLLNDYQQVPFFQLSMRTAGGQNWKLDMNTLCYCKEYDEKVNEEAEETEETEGIQEENEEIIHCISFMEPIERPNKEKTNNYLNPYVCALAYVAQKEDEAEYVVRLISAKTKTFNVSPSQARETLNAIYEAMSNLADIKYMDIDYLAGKDTSIPSTMAELLQTIENHTGWQYFNDKKMLIPEKDFGYADETTLSDEMTAVYAKIKAFIRYL